MTVISHDGPRGRRILVTLGGVDRSLDEASATELRDQLTRELGAPQALNDREAIVFAVAFELENAFRDAVRQLAQKIVTEMVNTDQVRKNIRDIAAAAFEKMVVNKDALAEKMANAIVDAMTRTS